ncbi:hypothetical protein ACFLYU_04310 [Candidatus Dependentiae bacterium]
MKKIFAIEALRFGFKSFFKNPIFFVLAFVVSKLIWIMGFCLSFLISLPYFIHLINFVLKIFNQIKGLIAEFSIQNIVSEFAKPVIKNLGFGVFDKVNVVGGFVKEMGQVVKGAAKVPLQVVKGAAEITPIAKVVKSMSGITAIRQKVDAALYEIKGILAEIMQSKFLFLFFIIGVIVFFVCVKMVYDFIMLGWARMSLGIYDRKSGSIRSLFSRPGIWIKYVIATLLFLLISIVPSLIYFWFYLLITYFVRIPQFIAYVGYAGAFIASWYLILRLWFYPYYLVDENIGSVASLQKSYNLGLGFLNVIISLFVFAVILGIPLLFVVLFPNVLTVTIFGVFLAIIWMSSWVSYAYMYRKLKR